ncbi:MAG: hypothetical protein IH944_02090 [Armatimonadetes bacterium]|nr:hypothetical protein [Armatimonadota bacterium]
MRVLLSKFCEYATQQRNGRHSMIGVFDNIVAPAFPLDHPPFFLCLQTEFEPTEAGEAMNVQAILIDADGKQVMDVTASGTVPGDSRGGATRIFIQFLLPPIRFESPGDYRLDVMFNGKKVGEERLPVIESETTKEPLRFFNA